MGRKKWFPFFAWGAVGKLGWVRTLMRLGLRLIDIYMYIRLPLAEGNPRNAFIRWFLRLPSWFTYAGFMPLIVRINCFWSDLPLGTTILEESSALDPEPLPSATVPSHPAGIQLSRSEYYTIPSLEELGRITDSEGSCVVENLTIGRDGYGSVFFPGE